MLEIKRSRVVLILLAVGMIGLAGCGASNPGTISVSGTVTLDGTPVEAASVTFIPDEGGRPGIGMTDAEGKFTLTTFEESDGAIPGPHKVTVRKTTSNAAAPTADPTAEGDEGGEGGEFMGADTGDAAETWITPAKYSLPATSGLTAEVESGMAPVELALTSG